jgi:hemerythrin-like domain-containing protein
MEATMADVIQTLQRDHNHMARLLMVLEKELDTAVGLGLPDFQRMQLVMKYMTHYPDEVHHPREDALFARLLDKVPAVGAAVSTLCAEHRVLAVKGQAFCAVLNTAATEHVIPREMFELPGREYIVTLHRHMRFEETEVFPVARDHLGSADWSAIKLGAGEQRDPIFGDSVESEFRDLYADIFAS